ncbi:hypothetical protein C8K30_11573 [Promicromonospora sp. AC04]|uniref:hypothetical protein n=1 Tax=Promicromonospora sp. AC04 TaxID=2135723 RepID=UPI000D3ADE38|nr:hypothetical protein [Promicromonospora sp. AC04]PUB20862.1 hypothetical protein C8K30_11573 [Promicromonospora sp. AC04]
MTTTTLPTSTAPETSTPDAGRPLFATSEGLRVLLIRLHIDGRDAWAKDPDATELLEFCMAKYGALAARYRQTQQDAAVAAFEVLRAPATLEAQDPWGVVTRAVQLSLMAEDRANGLLCDQSRARRLLTSDQHEATRFTDYELDGARSLDTLPTTADPVDTVSLDPAVLDHLDVVDVTSSRPSQIAPVEARTALDIAAKVLAGFGWEPTDARACLAYITERLTITGDTARAFEYLRRDKNALGRFDLELRQWTALCAVVLGHPHHPALAVRDGLLARLMRGQRTTELLADDRLVRAVLAASPAHPAGSAGSTQPDLEVECDA